MKGNSSMNHSVDKIVDKKQMKEIFEKRFSSLVAFIKTDDISIQVVSFKYEDNLITITLPRHVMNFDNAIIYVRDREKIIASHVSLQMAGEDNSFVFEPRDVMICDVPRKENRNKIENKNSAASVNIYVSNIISDFIIDESFIASRKRVDFIKNVLLQKISLENALLKIVLLNEIHNDERMKYFRTERKPYFYEDLKDVHDNEKLKNNSDLKRYAFSIYPSDPALEDKKIISEISVPLLYKFMLPFGYMKVTSQAKLTDTDFTTVRKFGMSVSTLFTNDKNLIKNSEERIAVTDLSMHGLGIVFKDKRLIKHFKDDSLIVFTVFLPEEKQATILCLVKNISLVQNYIYRVGCEIINIESIGEVHYSEYLEKL